MSSTDYVSRIEDKLPTNEYDLQASHFLDKTSTQFSAEFFYHGPFFSGENECRDVWRITLSRAHRKFSFKYGQSIDRSGPERIKPTPYDVLSILQKYDIGTYKNFCRDFVYDQNLETLQLYLALQEEYWELSKLFTGYELEQMAAIQ